ncbi:MAG: acetoacetyl-CoA reductase [Gammaproteobacteria bacterium]|nr:MAG: acetoacetyl-CoA reductase [Gammaproteobacteria bacterium]
MTDRLALVTGGTGGIGTEICAELAQQGYRVVATDLPNGGANGNAHGNGGIAEWRRGLQERGLDVAFEPADVSDFKSCLQLARTLERDYGTVEILVNGAGITRDSTLRKMNLVQWDEVLRVNLDSVFNISRQFIDGMLHQGFGRIVNIASVNGQRGQFGQTNYSAAKAGMHGFTMALARETAGKGITVNSVSPGYVETNMVMSIAEKIREKIIKQIPVGRFAHPAEIARLVGFLAADESGYITGANIPINGGYRIGT